MTKYIKQSIPKQIQDFLGLLKYRIKRDLRYFYYILKRQIRQARAKSTKKTLQQFTFSFVSELAFDSIDQMIATFEEKGLEFCQHGRHTVYLHHEGDISQINKEIVNRYPQPFGLKIIKGSEIADDGTPYYTSDKLAPSSSMITMRAVGSVREKMVISNILNQKKVAPRVYDIVKLSSGNKTIFAMIVQHINGKNVTGEPASEFIKQFKNVLNEEGISILGGEDHTDLQPPDYRDNIIADSTGTYYVDIQNFALFDRETVTKRLLNEIYEYTHFGDSRLFRPQKYAYQSIPGLTTIGKRDSDYRICMIQDFLFHNQVQLYDRHVLDVGCNIGVFMMYALNQGARWTVGLDTPEITKVTRQFLYERGYSRFNLVGCDLNKPDIANHLPYKKFDLVLYLSVENHIGFPEWLNELGFEYILYEGHAGESVKDIERKITRWSSQIEIIDCTITQDGDSDPRPILLGRIRHPFQRLAE